MTLKFGAYNGQGESLNDVNNKKSFGARGTVGDHAQARRRRRPGSPTTASSPSAGVPDSSFTNYAWGVDAQWGKPGDEGLYALAEYLHGNDPYARPSSTCRGIQGVAAYNIRMTSPTSWLYAVEPPFRVDLADPEHRRRR